MRAAHYGETVAKLKADPIIVGMADEIRDAIFGRGEAVNLEGWDFTQRALDTYLELGGTIQTHIGGPAEAICELVYPPDKDPSDGPEALKYLLRLTP